MKYDQTFNLIKSICQALLLVVVGVGDVCRNKFQTFLLLPWIYEFTIIHTGPAMSSAFISTISKRNMILELGDLSFFLCVYYTKNSSHLSSSHLQSVIRVFLINTKNRL